MFPDSGDPTLLRMIAALAIIAISLLMFRSINHLLLNRSAPAIEATSIVFA